MCDVEERILSHEQLGTESPITERKRESQKSFVGPNVGQGGKKVRFKDLDEIIPPEGQDSSQVKKDLEKSQKRSQKRSQELMGGID